MFILAPHGIDPLERRPSLTVERVAHGNTTVLIELTEDDARFRARWTCEKCGQSAQSPASYHRAVAARNWAKIGAHAHAAKHA